MAIYWIVLCVPVVAMLLQANPGRKPPKALWCAFTMVLVLFVGGRYEVGADWFNYVGHAEAARRMTVVEAISLFEPGYGFVTWATAKLGLGVGASHLLFAGIFVGGLMRFCYSQPQPLLALLAAIPYLVIVVGMGYTRQATGIGLIFAGFANLQKGQSGRFLLLTSAACCFHRASVLAMPLGVLVSPNRRVWMTVATLVAGSVFYVLVIAHFVGVILERYTVGGYISEGALARSAMNALAGCVFLVMRARLAVLGDEKRLWTVLSWAAVGLFVANLMVESSTVLDRAGLYLISVQMCVASRLPRAFMNKKWRIGAIVAIFVWCVCIQALWFAAASHSKYWIPYQNIALGATG